MSTAITWETVPARTVKAGQRLRVRHNSTQLVLEDARVMTNHRGRELAVIKHHGGYLTPSADYLVQVQVASS